MSRPIPPERPLWSSSAIDALIAGLELPAIQKSSTYTDPQGKNVIRLEFLGNSVERSGVPWERLKDTATEFRSPRAHTALTDGCIAELLRFSIYGAEPDIANYHSLQMKGCELHLRMHRILSASRHMATFTPEQMDALEARLAQLIAERDVAFRPRFEAEKKALELKAAVMSAGDNIDAQMGLLRVQDRAIVMPPQEYRLSQYVEIKNRIVKAGGKYRVNKEYGSHFTFADGHDVNEILATLQGGKKLNVQKETQFFGTSPRRAALAADTLGSLEGKDLLEPSAGEGALADVARARKANVTVIENWSVNAIALQKKGYAPIERDFLEVTPEDTGLFDAVLMNPPFTKHQDIRHINHAISFLKPDGQITAILSPIFQRASIKLHQQFANLTEIAQAKVEDLPQGEFKDSGTNVATVQWHIKMQDLMQALHERGEDGSEFGLDLSRQWALFNHEYGSVHRQRELVMA